MHQATVAPRKPRCKILYVQVLIAIVVGALLGWLFPDFAKNEWIKALGDGFVKLIKMVIAPIIFCRVVSGIAHISEVRKVGRVAVKALVYFELSRPLPWFSVSSSPTCCTPARASPARPMLRRSPASPNKPAR